MNCLQVIPPGMDFSNVVVQEEAAEADELIALTGSDGSSPKAVPTIWSEVSNGYIPSNAH